MSVIAGTIRSRASRFTLADGRRSGWRTIRKVGIRLDNADYIAGELGPLVGERVGIRRDAADPDRIFVYREDALRDGLVKAAH